MLGWVAASPLSLESWLQQLSKCISLKVNMRTGTLMQSWSEVDDNRLGQDIPDWEDQVSWAAGMHDLRELSVSSSKLP